MIVRTIQSYELDATMILFNYYRDEAVESLPRIAEEYDENSMIDTVRNYTIRNQYVWFNMYEGQRPVGFIAGFISATPWNKDLLVANISFVYLLTSHRSMDNFKSLYSKFEEWANSFEAYQITGGDIGINVDRSQRLYEHLGFKPVLLMVKETAE